MWPQLFSPCPDCSLEAQPKYVRGGKRYGRRSLPEFQESVEEFAEVTVIEPLDEEARPSHIPTGDRGQVRRGRGAGVATLGPGVAAMWRALSGAGAGAVLSYPQLANLITCFLDTCGYNFFNCLHVFVSSDLGRVDISVHALCS